MAEIGFIGCMQESIIGNIVIGLTIYGLLATLVIFILIWVLKNQFNKNKGETQNESNNNLPKN